MLAQLGQYKILDRIGAGGMGEVYRARDTRLGRDVSIKVSAERFNERFEREAKLIACRPHARRNAAGSRLAISRDSNAELFR